MNSNVAVKILKEFTRCLDDKYFLVYGTCLGANREQNIISHDLDIDIGIMRDDFKLSLLNNLVNSGFDIIQIFGSLEVGLEISFKKNGIKVDLMVFYIGEGRLWNSLWLNGGRNGLSDMIVHSYSEELFEIKELKVGDNYFYSLGEEYIKRVYGDDWKIPVKEWNWRTDHLCLDDSLRFKILKKYGK